MQKRKKFMVLDVETTSTELATKKGKACNFPLIYDLGYIITDLNGYIYKKVNLLIDEIFNYSPLFNLAYYANKRSIYIDLLNKGKIKLVSFKKAYNILDEDLQQVEFVTAFNGGFDARALKFTEEYLRNKDNQAYLNRLDEKIRNYKPEKAYKIPDKSFLEMTFEELEEYSNFLTKMWNTMMFHNKLVFDMRFEIFDKKGLNVKYKNFCIKNDFLSKSKKFVSTTAETCHRFLSDDMDFMEAHTALEDSLIEKEIFLKAYKKRKFRFETTRINYPTHQLMRL